jgi:hypothetical protein
MFVSNTSLIHTLIGFARIRLVWSILHLYYGYRFGYICILLMWNLTVTRIISFRLMFDCHDIHVSIWYMYQDSIIRFDHRAQALYRMTFPYTVPTRIVSLTYTCLPQVNTIAADISVNVPAKGRVRSPPLRIMLEYLSLRFQTVVMR